MSGAGSFLESTVDSTITVRIGNGTDIDADGDVDAKAESLTDLTTSAGAASGSLLAGLGAAVVDVTLINVTDAFVGEDVIIDTRGNFSLLATTDHLIRGGAEFFGGALLLGLAEATTTATVNDRTATTIGAGSNITADGLLDVAAVVDIDAEPTTDVEAGGLASFGYAETTLNVTAITTTTVDAEAELRGDNVSIEATATQIRAHANATSDGSGGGVDANATATAMTISTATVTIHGDAKIVGELTTTLAADQSILNTRADAETEIDGLFGLNMVKLLIDHQHRQQWTINTVYQLLICQMVSSPFLNIVNHTAERIQRVLPGSALATGNAQRFRAPVAIYFLMFDSLLTR